MTDDEKISHLIERLESQRGDMDENRREAHEIWALAEKRIKALEERQDKLESRQDKRDADFVSALSSLAHAQANLQMAHSATIEALEQLKPGLSGKGDE
jgi:chromosome segregation ATPase